MNRFTPDERARANAALQDNLQRAEPRIVASYALIGAILLLGGVGYALDRWFSSAPWGLLTGLIDNVVRTLILQGRSKMHPLVSLVAIFGGMEMFGILGIFLGPILAAILIVL